MSLRVAFRTGGSHSQGMGDIALSLAIADELRSGGDEVMFLVSGEAVAVDAVRAHRFSCDATNSPDEEDAALARIRPDVVVVSMLSQSAAWIQRLKATGARVVAIDDSGPGAQAADVALNVLYRGPRGLLDLNHVALSQPFADAHTLARRAAPQVRNILVTQGGSDTPGFTPKIVRALNGISGTPECVVVIGPAYRHHTELRDALHDHRLRVEVRRGVAEMTPLMLAADLAITAGGITMLELACVGTPSIAVCGDAFEEETAVRVAAAGASINLGFGGPVEETAIARAVDDLSSDPDRRARMSAAGKALVDGHGAPRLAMLVRSACSEPVAR